MTSTNSPLLDTGLVSTRTRGGRSPRDDASRAKRDRAKRGHHRAHERRALARYTDSCGRTREIFTRAGLAGSVLVVDRDEATRGDPRLVAHLGADEPAENAAVACGCYVQQARCAGYRCRRLTEEDFHTEPFVEDLHAAPNPEGEAGELTAVDRLKREYRLERLDTGMSIPEMRWRRHCGRQTTVEPQIVSVREAIAGLERYEPVRLLTSRALVAHSERGAVSMSVLRLELARMQESPIVLNRGLREAVLAAAERQGLSMSEIAMRCGRVKRDRAGNESGETSWLARRLGLLPEGGRQSPTPWIHSDVLALIARRGLGISPREVELA